MKARVDFEPMEISFQKEELEALNLIGVPICVDHNETTKVGVISENHVDVDGYLWITADLTVPPDFQYRGLAIHVMARLDADGRILAHSKIVKDVSLCLESRYDFAQVETWVVLEYIS